MAHYGVSRCDISGAWYFSGSGLPCSVAGTSASPTFTNEGGGSTQAAWSNCTKLAIPAWSVTIQTTSDCQSMLFSNGTYWSRQNPCPNRCDITGGWLYNGQGCNITGPNEHPTFVNEGGGPAAATWSGCDTLTLAWGTVTTSADCQKLMFDNGTFWSR